MSYRGLKFPQVEPGRLQVRTLVLVFATAVATVGRFCYIVLTFVRDEQEESVLSLGDNIPKIVGPFLLQAQAIIQKHWNLSNTRPPLLHNTLMLHQTSQCMDDVGVPIIRIMAFGGLYCCPPI